MTYFKLDIPKINESISRYKDIKGNCLEDIGILYRGLGYTESGWNDPNAYTFIEKVKKDKYKINEYFDYLDSLYNEINQFKTNIDSICSKEGYRKNTITLKFDDTNLNQIKRYLDNAITFLNDSLNRINISAFKPDFEYIGLIYGLRSEIKIIKNSINELKQSINSFINSINNEIYDSKFRLKRIGNFSLNLNVAEYKWRVTDLETKTINKINQELYKDVRDIKIENKVQDSMLSGPSTSYISKVNEIKTEDAEKVNNLNNNLNYSFASENEIGLEKSRKVDGLRNDLNDIYSKKTDIDLNKSQTVNGLNNNINTVLTKDVGVKNENVNKIEGLNNNLNSNSANQNSISFESVRNINNLNNNISSAKTNNNNINYNIDNSVNVANNIINAKVNQTNMNTSNVISNNYDLSSGINSVEVKSTGITSDISKNINLDTNIKEMESLSELDKK